MTNFDLSQKYIFDDISGSNIIMKPPLLIKISKLYHLN